MAVHNSIADPPVTTLPRCSRRLLPARGSGVRWRCGRPSRCGPAPISPTHPISTRPPPLLARYARARCGRCVPPASDRPTDVPTGSMPSWAKAARVTLIAGSRVDEQRRHRQHLADGNWSHAVAVISPGAWIRMDDATGRPLKLRRASWRTTTLASHHCPQPPRRARRLGTRPSSHHPVHRETGGHFAHEPPSPRDHPVDIHPTPTGRPQCHAPRSTRIHRTAARRRSPARRRRGCRAPAPQ